MDTQVQLRICARGRVHRLWLLPEVRRQVRACGPALGTYVHFTTAGCQPLNTEQKHEVCLGGSWSSCWAQLAGATSGHATCVDKIRACCLYLPLLVSPPKLRPPRARRYNTRCANGYICASGGSCPIVPSPSSVKACPANLASTSDADVDFSYQPAHLSDLPAEVVEELSDELLPDEILMQMPPSPAPAPAATTRAPSPSPAPTPSPQTVTADRASTARQQDNTTAGAASSADPASVPQTSDAQLQAAALATDTPADVMAPETGSAASAGGAAQTTAAGSSSGTALICLKERNTHKRT